MLAWLWHGNSTAGTTGLDTNRVPSEKSRNSSVDRARHNDHCKECNCDATRPAAVHGSTARGSVRNPRRHVVLPWRQSLCPRYSVICRNSDCAACPGGNGFDFRAASPAFFVFLQQPSQKCMETYLKYAMTTSFISHRVIRRYINQADAESQLNNKRGNKGKALPVTGCGGP
jgi:hypothetical protein